VRKAVAGLAGGGIASGVPTAEDQIHVAATTSQRDFLRASFRAMLTARILENKLSSLYKAGKIVGGVYLGRGQEAVSATLGTSLIQGRDCFAPLIRDQAEDGVR
jgi:acetoin:2,6-dichlorophenolindophenol oxidoreductase subunit alpha